MVVVAGGRRRSVGREDVREVARCVCHLANSSSSIITSPLVSSPLPSLNSQYHRTLTTSPINLSTTATATPSTTATAPPSPWEAVTASRCTTVDMWEVLMASELLIPGSSLLLIHILASLILPARHRAAPLQERCCERCPKVTNDIQWRG
ncbi:hypothetical protein E2C01_065610 [Portunus trituberculatus]|uniref:Uncharacterized protein n=1 Tax=Portunus trituberculatus TaxID=210409 RepID=A0A5B7HMB9_PORTR|nr:hypothetical protein [Portunus trituberculatus]